MNTSRKIVAVTQPDFFPWLGSIAKIYSSDIFVFLDSVTNRPNDGIWTKRVKIIVQGEPKWLTVPLKKPAGGEFQRICDMVIDEPSSVKDKHLKTIIQSYSKAPYFKDVIPFIEGFYENSSEFIAERNKDFIRAVMSKTGYTKDFLSSSEMKCKGRSNELLIEIVRKAGGNAYLVGGGSAGYLKPVLFQDNGIELVYQEFEHPVYRQHNSALFQKGLSVIDALMNIGFGGVSGMLSQKSKGN